MKEDDKSSYLHSSDGVEKLHYDEVAKQIVYGELGMRGILEGSKPDPRFLILLMNSLREKSGMVHPDSAFKSKVIPQCIFDDYLVTLDHAFQLRIHEQQQAASKKLATVGWVLSGVGIAIGILQAVFAILV